MFTRPGTTEMNHKKWCNEIKKIINMVYDLQKCITTYIKKNRKAYGQDRQWQDINIHKKSNRTWLKTCDCAFAHSVPQKCWTKTCCDLLKTGTQSTTLNPKDVCLLERRGSYLILTDFCKFCRRRDEMVIGLRPLFEQYIKYQQGAVRPVEQWQQQLCRWFAYKYFK